MDEIIPGLWIGDLACALDADYLDLANVTHIVSVMKQTLKPPMQLPSGRQIAKDNIKQIRVDDVEEAPILVHFNGMSELINEVLDETWIDDDGPGEGRQQNLEEKWGHWETFGQGTVFVHCQAGVSRSVTLVAAYLMWKRNIDTEAALSIIKERRPQVDPNHGFLSQLDLYRRCDYQIDLRHKDVRRFLMSKTNVLNGDSVDDMLMSYYPSPHPSPSVARSQLGLTSTMELPQNSRIGWKDSPSSASMEHSGSSSTQGSHHRPRRFSNTHSPLGYKKEIDLSVSPGLPDSFEKMEESDFTKGSKHMSSSLSQPASEEVKVTEVQGRLPGGVSSLRGNETSLNKGKLPRPKYTGPVLRCKMCRRELASVQDHLIDHQPGRGQLAFDHKKRTAPGSSQASAATRSGYSRNDGISVGPASAPGTTDVSPEQGQSDSSTPATAGDEDGSGGSGAATPAGDGGANTRTMQSAASLSASLPPHLAALRLGRAAPAAASPAARMQRPTADGLSIETGQAAPPLSGPASSLQPPSGPTTPALPSDACSSYFVEPLQWMSALKEGEVFGRLDCPAPQCGAKLGSWDWAGMQCGCGAWVTPAFALHRSKIDVV